jgi:hypothetical protein
VSVAPLALLELESPPQIVGNGTAGVWNELGSGRETGLNTPSGLLADGAGGVIIADMQNRCVRQYFASNASVVTLAGRVRALAFAFPICSFALALTQSPLLSLTVRHQWLLGRWSAGKRRAIGKSAWPLR